MGCNENYEIKFPTIEELKNACLGQNTNYRLFLPTLQRSLIWDNARILNYWDSLSKGWFPGLFMLSDLKCNTLAYLIEGATTQLVRTAAGDKEIFDGQQRMSAIILGFGKGRLARSKKIWVGIPKTNSQTNDLKFRMTSLGQPFGYKFKEPNDKLDLGIRRKCYANLSNDLSPLEKNKQAFSCDTDNYLYKSEDFQNYQWYPLKSVLQGVHDHDDDLLVQFRQRILKTKVLVRMISESEFSQYEEFFKRIGQGGVRLSEDELTFALMNRQFPELRPHIEKIVDNKDIGYLASPTDIALGLFRLAKVDAFAASDQKENKEWVRANRPTPDFIRSLDESQESVDKNDIASKNIFKNWLNGTDSEHSYPEQLMRNVRKLLLFKDDYNASPMILAYFNKYVIEVAMALCHNKLLKQYDEKLRFAFCYWTFFFSDSEKVAYQLAVEMSDPQREHSDVLQKIAASMTEEGKAFIVPTQSDFKKIRDNIRGFKCLMPTESWFSAADVPQEKRVSEIFNQLNFWHPRGKSLLLCSQRDELNRDFTNYDPISENDDDLPVDLDHIIARKRFNFRWGNNEANNIKKNLGDSEQAELFRWTRTDLGNLIGNLRWLDACENRSRGEGTKEETIELHDQYTDSVKADGDATGYVNKFMSFHQHFFDDDATLADSKRDYIIDWQNTVLLRTVDLFESLINDLGIYTLFPASSE